MTAEGGAAGSGPTDTVLVVDSDVLVRMEIASYLRDCAYKVLEAPRAEEALVLLSRSKVDAVLADVDLPGSMNGFALARWLREHRPGVSVFLASTPPMAADLAADLCEEGPLLARPYDPQLVLERIRKLKAEVERR